MCILVQPTTPILHLKKNITKMKIQKNIFPDKTISKNIIRPSPNNPPPPLFNLSQIGRNFGIYFFQPIPWDFGQKNTSRKLISKSCLRPEQTQPSKRAVEVGRVSDCFPETEIQYQMEVRHPPTLFLSIEANPQKK